MRKIILSLGLFPRLFISILLTLLFISMLMPAFGIHLVKAVATTWTVDDDGPADFQTIQEAIDAAISGDTIYVYNGIYYENVNVYKSISLIGENRENTIIDGRKISDTIYVKASNVLITRFTIRNALRSNLRFSHYSANGEVQLSQHNTILFNTIMNGDTGIVLQRNWCRILDGNYGWNRISNNHIENNICGVDLDESDGNLIDGNNITGHLIGIINCPLIDYGDATVTNIFSHNNFLQNERQVTNGVFNDTWDDGYPSGGNYWSDYAGADLYGGLDQNMTGPDLIGDVPYAVDANNIDRYPLTTPFHFSAECPTAICTWNSDGPLSNRTIIFDASSSLPNVGTIVEYVWDFGDGIGSIGRTATHAYTSSGTYTVILNVTNSRGLSDVARETIRFVAFSYSEPESAHATITPQDKVVDVLDSVTFTVTVTNRVPPYAILWYRNETMQFSVENLTTATFAFDIVGNEVIKACVTDAGGTNVNATSRVIILPPHPSFLEIDHADGATVIYTNMTQELVVNITVTAVTDLWAWQVNLTWDPKVLDFENVTLPPDNVFAEAMAQGYLTKTAGPVEGTGNMVYGVTLLSLSGDPYTFNGTGVLAQVRFRIIRFPESTPGTFEIGFLNKYSDTFMLDFLGNTISMHSEENMTFSYVHAPVVEHHVAAFGNSVFWTYSNASILANSITGTAGGPWSITFNTYGNSGSVGFVNTTIPRASLEGPRQQVLVNGTDVNATAIYTVTPTNTYVYITFLFSSTITIQVIGTIPEPSSPVTESDASTGNSTITTQSSPIAGTDSDALTASGSNGSDSVTESVVATQEPAPSMLFSDGFESGNANAWDGIITSTGGSATVSTMQPHDGTYHLTSKITSSGTTNERAYAYTTFANEVEIHSRGYLYIQNGLPLIADTNRIDIIAVQSCGVVIASFCVEKNTGADRWAIRTQVGEFYATSGATALQWYEFEIYVLIDATVGTYRFSIDGAIVAERTGVDTTTALNGGLINRLNFGITYTSGVTNANIYCDTLEIGNEPLAQNHASSVHDVPLGDSRISSVWFIIVGVAFAVASYTPIKRKCAGKPSNRACPIRFSCHSSDSKGILGLFLFHN